MDRINRLATIGELSRASDTPHFTIYTNRYSGTLQPKIPNTGNGTVRYSLCQVLAIRVARLLDKKFRVSPLDMRDLVSRLWHMETAELAAEFEAGRILTVLVNRIPSAVFFPAEAIPDITAHLLSRNIIAAVVGISLKNEWEKMLRRLTPGDMSPDPEESGTELK